MCKGDVSLLSSDGFSTQDDLSQQMEVALASDAAQQYPMTGEHLEPTKTQSDGPGPGVRQPVADLQFGQGIDLIFPAQGHVHGNQAALYGVKNLPYRLEFRGKMAGDVQAQLPASLLGSRRQRFRWIEQRLSPICYHITSCNTWLAIRARGCRF